MGLKSPVETAVSRHRGVGVLGARLLGFKMREMGLKPSVETASL